MTWFVHLMDQKKPWNRYHSFNNSINQETHTHTPHGAPQTSNEEDIVYKGPSSDGLIHRNSEGADASYDQTRSALGTFNIALNSS